MKNRLYYAGFLFGMVTLCLSAELYVAPDGCDVNPGTPDQPLATLEGAREVIREWRQLDRFTGEDITIYLRGGDYRIERTVVFDEQDSGDSTHRIIYRSYPGEQARLIGGRILEPCLFKPVTDRQALQKIPSDVLANVMQVDLKSQGITNYGRHRQFGHALPVVSAPLELVFNGDAMPLARYPNHGNIKIGKIIDSGSIPRVGDYNNIRGGIFEYTDDRHERWVGVQDVWLQGTFRHGFSDDKIRVDWINPKTHQVKLATPHMYGLGSGEDFQQYIALNLLEELDQPGEWYLDRQSGILYVWPPSEITNARIIVSMLEEPIIALEGVSYMTLRGLTVEGGRGMAIYMERGEHNRIAGCTVHNMGTSGIFMGQGSIQTFPYYITHDDYKGVPVSRRIGNLQGHIFNNTTWDRKAGNNHQIISCDVYNTGCGGIYLSGGSKKDLIPGHCEVINCRVHDYNRRNKFLWSGVNVDGCGNRIAYCEIYNSDFQGIYVHGNDHIFEYNHLHHLAMNSNDTSAWYLGRDPSDRGNIIRYNFFHHVGRLDRMVMGVYLDDATCGVAIEGNVFYKVATHGTVYSNTALDVKVRNNIFVESPGPAVWLSSMFYGWGKGEVQDFFGENGIYRRRLTVSVDIKKPPYSERYPELADWLDPIVPGKEWVGMRPRRNLMENNIVVNCKEKLKLESEYAQFEDKDNLEFQEDPGFVDAEAMNFQLRDDSSVYQKLPKFKPIPFDKIGLYKDEFRDNL